MRKIEFPAGRVGGVLTERGRIGCDAVLVAGSAWAGMPLRHHGVPFLQASIQSTSFATAPMPEVTAGGCTVGTSGFGRLHVSPRRIMQMRPFWKTFLKRRRS